MFNMFYANPRSENGLSLIDIIFAASIVLLVAISFVPLIVFGANTIQSNNIKSIAREIASEEIERIKSLPYDDIGVVNGNPPGVLDASKVVVRNNRNFQVDTRVKWYDDPSDGLLPDDKDPRDLKKVTVTVSWTLFGKKNSLRVITKIARESKEPLPPGGHIVVQLKSYQSNLNLEDIKVNLVSGPSAPRYDYSDEKGEVVFAALENGTYVVKVDPPINTLCYPEQQEVTIEFGDIKYIEFYLAPKGALSVRLLDPFRNLITKRSQITLSHPLGIQLSQSANTGEFYFDNVFPGVWTVTEAKAASYEPTSGATVEVIPGETATLEIIMSPRPSANLHLTVYDLLTRDPIPGAGITLTDKETSEVITGQTNEQGIYEKSLNAGMYLLLVQKDGYNDYSSEVELKPSQNTFLEVFLTQTPKFGAIRVRTERTNGAPRNNVAIRVIGPGGYNRVQLTGNYAPGETLFENLTPGTYKVYRRYGIWWIDERIVDVSGGETKYVLYRY